jgi:hypothetical protein
VKLPNIRGLVGVGKVFVQTNRPEILFGASVVAQLAAVVAAARGGYKSGQQVMAQEYALEVDSLAKNIELTPKEKFQLTWINYLPAAGLTLGAVGSTTGLHLVHVKEKKQLAAAALMAIEQVKVEANQYIDDVKAAVKENVTEKKLGAIDDAVLEKQAERNNGVAFAQNSDGEIEELYLVRDAKTQRDIWSNKAKIEEALLECNRLLLTEGSCDLDTFYSYAGYNVIPDGGNMGWSGEEIHVIWSNTTRDDGRPVREFTFRPAPKSGP